MGSVDTPIQLCGQLCSTTSIVPCWWRGWLEPACVWCTPTTPTTHFSLNSQDKSRSSLVALLRLECRCVIVLVFSGMEYKLVLLTQLCTGSPSLSLELLPSQSPVTFSKSKIALQDDMAVNMINSPTRHLAGLQRTVAPLPSALPTLGRDSQLSCVSFMDRGHNASPHHSLSSFAFSIAARFSASASHYYNSPLLSQCCDCVSRKTK